MTIQTVGDEKVLEQIEKQLHKLVDVLRVSELGQGAHVEREIMLVKIQASGYGREEVKTQHGDFPRANHRCHAVYLHRTTGGHQR